MTAPTASVDPLTEALAIRLRRIDLVAWQRIVSWAERSELSLAHLRILLAVAIEEVPAAASLLAQGSGLSLDAAYPAIHDLARRGYLHEARRRYELSERGRDLVATLDEAHRDGIQAYVDGLDPEERRRLDMAFGIAREGTR